MGYNQINGMSGNDWMSKLDGTKKISELSIPGSHDSSASQGLYEWLPPFVDSLPNAIPHTNIPFFGDFAKKAWGILGNLLTSIISTGVDTIIRPAQTQEENIVKQLDAGVRFFDLRFRAVNGRTVANHGMVALDQEGKEMMEELQSFLQKNPSETIILSIKDENTNGQSIPIGSAIPGALDTVNKLIDTLNSLSSFHKTIDWDASDWKWMIPNHPNMGLQRMEFEGDQLTINSAIGEDPLVTIESELVNNFDFYTGNEIPTLDEVRGKMVLFNRYDSSNSGYKGLKWNQSIDGHQWHIQDHYSSPSIDEKKSYIKQMLDSTRSSNWNAGDIALNFTSATIMPRGPIYYSNPINRMVHDYLVSNDGFVGTVVMDYIEPSLAKAIYEHNPRTIKGTMMGDRVSGGYHNDQLFGYQGDDILFGDLGSDQLSGGEGADIFEYRKPADSSSNPDIILDFDVAEDKIDLTALDGHKEKNGFQKLFWIGSDAFSSTAGEVRFDSTTNTLEVNTDGDVNDEMQIILKGVTSITNDSLIL